MKLLAKRSVRTGTTLLEVIASVTLLGAGLGMTAQVLHTTSMLRRENERRQHAMQEAVNVLEEVRALSWSQLSPDSPPKVALSEAARRQLPRARLTLEITAEPNDQLARRLTVEIAWRLRSGQPAAPVRLTAWRWQREAAP